MFPLLFHITLAKSLPSILLHGLKPRIGPRSKALGEAVPRVYCFVTRESAEEAVGGWLGEEFGGVPLRLLTLNAESLPCSVTDGFTCEVVVSEVIPPGLIASVEEI